MPFVRSGGTGMLARYVQAHPTYPFNVADWSAQTGLTLGVDLGTGSLTLTYTNPLVDTGWRFIRPTAVASRAETLVHTVVRGFNLTKVTSFGPVPYWDGLDFVMGAFSATAKSVRVNASVSNVQAFHPYGGVTDVLFSDGAAPARVDGTQYRQTVWANGADCAAHDFDSGYSGTAGLLGLAAGYPGVGTTHDTTDTPGCYTAVDSFFACKGRYLVVSNVPVGYTVKLVRSDLAVLATAVANIAGVATLDCLPVSLPDPHFLAVYTPAPLLVEQSIPVDALGVNVDGVWPGESYVYDPAGIGALLGPAALTAGNIILG